MDHLSQAQRFAQIGSVIVGSIFVHLWLVLASRIFESARPFGDLSLYNFWADQLNQGMPILGLQTDWVYPALALIPIWLPSFLLNYEFGWLLLIFFLNTSVALALNIRSPARSRPSQAGWIYLASLVALGPVAISRIDSVSLALAIFGMIAIGAGHMKSATAWLTLAGWVKIWPIAVFLAMLAGFKDRKGPLLVATGISAAILLIGFSQGGLSVLSFINTQQGRGLQIEAVLATGWLWLASVGLAEIYFDDEILTNQIRGAWVNELSGITNWVLFLAIAAVFVLALRANQKGLESRTVFVWAALAGVAALIVFNKVGSPQFILWLALPLIAGVYFRTPRFGFVLVFGLAVGVLTQLVYPVFYLDLLALQVGPLALLTLRNLLVIGLLVIGVLRLTRKQTLN